MTKYGSWEGPVVYPGSTPPGPTLIPPPRVHPPCRTAALATAAPGYPESNMVVGLISVAQLSSYGLFSGFWTITEVSNLLVAGNPNDHFLISQKE